MNILIVVLQSAVLHLSFGLSGKTCEINGKIICCYNHEEANGVCLQCKNGTVAKGGSRCRPCSNNTYGLKCIGRCNCKQNERCDAVEGCIFWIASTTSTLYQDEKTNMDSTERVHKNETTISNDNYSTHVGLVTEISVVTKSEKENNSESIGVVTKISVETKSEKEHDNDSKELATKISVKTKSEKEYNLSKREWIVYSLCIGTVVLVLGLSHLARKCRKLRLTTKVSARGAKIQHKNEIREETYNVYDEIDDTQITETTLTVDILTNTNSLEIRENNGVETYLSESQFGDSDGYLHPCNSVQDSLKEDNYSYNENTIGSSSDSDSQFDGSCNEHFLNPYHMLNSNRQISINKYETMVTVHAFASSLTIHDTIDAQSGCQDGRKDTTTEVDSEPEEVV